MKSANQIRPTPWTLRQVRSVNFSRPAGIVATLVITLAALAGPAQADVLSGTFDGVSTLTPTGTPGVFMQNFSGDGNDTLFGAFIPSSQSTIDFSHPPNIFVSGTFLETFNDGTLEGTTSGTGTANSQGMAIFTADLVFTAGTGIFAGDTGNAIVTGTLTRTSPTIVTVDASYTGVLVPEPSAWALLATVLVGLGLGRRKQIFPLPKTDLSPLVRRKR